MKKLIYLCLGLLGLVSCIDDQSDWGGRPISRIIPMDSLEKSYTVHKLDNLILEAPQVKQENEAKSLAYEWQVNYEVQSTSATLNYKCNTCGVFPCRLKISNEDGASFYEFELKVPYPYEEGLAVLSHYDGRSMVSFRNVKIEGESFGRDVYLLNSPQVSLGNQPKSILYNEKHNYLYIATEDPVKVVKVDARTMEVLSVIKYPEPRIERMFANGDDGITFMGGGRMADMNCSGENFMNTFQQGMYPNAYLANEVLITYSVFNGTNYFTFDDAWDYFVTSQWGEAITVFEEIQANYWVKMLPCKNPDEGLLLVEQAGGSVEVVYVNLKTQSIKSRWIETKGNLTNAGAFTTSMVDNILYYTKGNEIFRYNFESDGNFPAISDYTVGETGDVIQALLLDPEEENLYVAVDAAGNDDYKGGVYCYDVTSKTLKWKETGVAGEIVEMIYKK